MAIKIRKKRTDDNIQTTDDYIANEEIDMPEVIIDENLDDQFIRTSVTVHGWFLEHARIIFALVTLIILAVVAFSIYSYMQEKERIAISDDLMQSVYTSTMMTQTQAQEQEALFAQNPGLENMKIQHFVPDNTKRFMAMRDHTSKFIETHATSPMLPLANLMLSGTYMELDQPAQALAALDKSAKTADDRYSIFIMQGRVNALLDTNKIDEAIAELDKIAGLSDVYAPAALLQKAQVLDQTKQREKAIAAYNNLIERYGNADEAKLAAFRLSMIETDKDADNKANTNDNQANNAGK